MSEMAVLAFAGLGLALYRLFKTRSAKKEIEDRLVQLYSMSLQITGNMLKLQEQVFDRLRLGAQNLGLPTSSALIQRLQQVERDLAESRLMYGSANLLGDAESINWEALLRTNADCEVNWNTLVEILGPSEDERRKRLASAEARIEELERQVDSMADHSLGAGPDYEEARKAADLMEGRWNDQVQEAERHDAAAQQAVNAVSVEIENLQEVNERLAALSAKLRERQQAMARRIAELEAQAGLTPRLKEQLKELTAANAELHDELRRMEEANQAIQSQMATLRETMQALESQPPRSEALKARIAQDRQVLQLLREQNQRLIFELEEAREEAELALKQTPEEIAGRCRGLEEENEQLLAQNLQDQRALNERQFELEELHRELRKLRKLCATPAGEA